MLFYPICASCATQVALPGNMQPSSIIDDSVFKLRLVNKSDTFMKNQYQYCPMAGNPINTRIPNLSMPLHNNGLITILISHMLCRNWIFRDMHIFFTACSLQSKVNLVFRYHASIYMHNLCMRASSTLENDYLDGFYRGASAFRLKIIHANQCAIAKKNLFVFACLSACTNAFIPHIVI